MTSTPRQRLRQIEMTRDQAFKEYENNQANATPTQFDALQKNLRRAKINLFDAANSILDKNNSAVETAFNAAKAANKEVKEAIDANKSLTERIKKVSKSISKGKDLLEKAFSKIK